MERNEDLLFRLRAPNIDMVDLDELAEKHTLILEDEISDEKNRREEAAEETEPDGAPEDQLTAEEIEYFRNKREETLP